MGRGPGHTLYGVCAQSEGVCGDLCGCGGERAVLVTGRRGYVFILNTSGGAPTRTDAEKSLKGAKSQSVFGSGLGILFLSKLLNILQTLHHLTGGLHKVAVNTVKMMEFRSFRGG